MKINTIKILLIALLPFIALNAVAQETEENVRMEYILCTLNEGFTFKDVIDDAKKYGEKVKAEGSKYNQYLLRPMIVGERLGEVTHILAGVWPNGEELYREYGSYVNKYIDEGNENDPHTCKITVATMDRIVLNDFRENEKTDKRYPVQLADCTLKEGVSMDYAIEVQKEVDKATMSNGMRGYGVHFQVPYLGFEDIEYDFISAVWWQSFEHRGNMAQNYYKVANKHEQKMNSVVSCKNDRTYFVEEIFKTF